MFALDSVALLSIFYYIDNMKMEKETLISCIHLSLTRTLPFVWINFLSLQNRTSNLTRQPGLGRLPIQKKSNDIVWLIVSSVWLEVFFVCLLFGLFVCFFPQFYITGDVEVQRHAKMGEKKRQGNTINHFLTSDTSSY